MPNDFINEIQRRAETLAADNIPEYDEKTVVLLRTAMLIGASLALNMQVCSELDMTDEAAVNLFNGIESGLDTLLPS